MGPGHLDREKATLLLARAVAIRAGGPEGRRLAVVSRRVRDTNVPYAQVLWRQARSCALSRLGEHEEALALAREAVVYNADPNGLHGRTEALENLGEVAAAAGEIEEARRAFDEGVALAEQKGCIVCARRLGASRDALVG